MLNRLDKILDIIEKPLNIIAGVMLLGLMLLGTVNVIARFVFNTPLIGTTEYMRLLMAGSFLLVLANAQAKKQHTAMTDLVAHYPVKARQIIEFIVLFIALILFSIMTWRSAILVNTMWQRGDLVETIRIAAAPFRIMLPLGTFVLCLELIRQILHLVVVMKRRGN